MTQQLSGHFTLSRGEFDLDTGKFSIPTSGVTALFGRSGCGKTSLLRSIAGLEPNAVGSLTFKKTVWQDGDGIRVPTHQRQLAYVLQDGALFSHLSVGDNLRYGWKRHQQQANFEQIVESMQLGDLLHRGIEYLSGGEARRVAIGRALLSSPQLLLMDEPLASLDSVSRRELLTLIESTIQELDIPVLYVTHSALEVQRLADQVLFMQAGNVQTLETIEQATSRIDSPLFVDDGPVTIISGLFTDTDSRFGLARITIGKDQMLVAGLVANSGDTIRLRLAARDISISLSAATDSSVLNILAITIKALHLRDNHKVLVEAELSSGLVLLIEITQRSAQMLALEPGLKAYAQIKAVAVVD